MQSVLYPLILTLYSVPSIVCISSNVNNFVLSSRRGVGEKMNRSQRENELLQEAQAELKLLALKGVDPDSIEQQAMEACIRVLTARKALDAKITPEVVQEFDDALEALQKLFPSRGWSTAHKFGVTASVMFCAYGVYRLLERLRERGGKGE